jgi:hypothetical protein
MMLLLRLSLNALALGIIRPQPRHPGVSIVAAVWLRLRPSAHKYVFPMTRKEKAAARTASRERAGAS